MNILLTGGTGFIGSALTQTLVEQNHCVHILTRHPEQYSNTSQVTYINTLEDIAPSQAINAVINLAGEPLGAKRWNAARKQLFIDSRVQITNQLIDWMMQRSQRPAVFISGSAIGWYGEQNHQPLTEQQPAQDCFSHQLCEAWERTADIASTFNIRVCRLRIGIVLAADGGPLKEMLLPFKLGAGGPMGNGRQYWSWIHRDDLINIILHCMTKPELEGAINATSPNAVMQKDFAKTLGKTLHRPAIFPMPAWLAKLAIGEFSEEVLLQGQWVYPAKLTEHGFKFTYPSLAKALQSMKL